MGGGAYFCLTLLLLQPCLAQKVTLQKARYCVKYSGVAEDVGNFFRDAGCAVARLWGNCKEKEHKKSEGCLERENTALGQALDDAGVGNAIKDVVANPIKNVMYVEMFPEVNKQNVHFIALFSSGQQSPGGGGFNDFSSGAGANFYNLHGDTGSGVTANMYSTSLAGEFYSWVTSNNAWPLSETYALSLWDSNFDHELSIGEKNSFIEGYVNYLGQKVEWGNIEGIYLAGGSRGGCLAMRLAQKLADKSLAPNVKIIVHNVDGVCKKSQNEFGVDSPMIDNPRNSNYKAYQTDMGVQFQSALDKGINLCVPSLVGGEEVVVVDVSGVFAFSHVDVIAWRYLETDFYGRIWFKQQWIDQDHASLTQTGGANKWNILGDFRTHFLSCL